MSVSSLCKSCFTMSKFPFRHAKRRYSLMFLRPFSHLKYSKILKIIETFEDLHFSRLLRLNLCNGSDSCIQSDSLIGLKALQTFSTPHYWNFVENEKQILSNLHWICDCIACQIIVIRWYFWSRFHVQSIGWWIDGNLLRQVSHFSAMLNPKDRRFEKGFDEGLDFWWLCPSSTTVMWLLIFSNGKFF